MRRRRSNSGSFLLLLSSLIKSFCSRKGNFLPLRFCGNKRILLSSCYSFLLVRTRRRIFFPSRGSQWPCSSMVGEKVVPLHWLRVQILTFFALCAKVFSRKALPPFTPLLREKKNCLSPSPAMMVRKVVCAFTKRGVGEREKKYFSAMDEKYSAADSNNKEGTRRKKLRRKNEKTWVNIARGPLG